MAVKNSERNRHAMADPSGTRVRRGSPSPHITDLYGRFGASIYRRALFLLRDTDEARDVTQDAFVSLVEQGGRLEATPVTASLLHQVATCLAIDRLRRRSRWSGPFPSEEEAPGTEPEREPSHKGDQGRIEAAKDLALLTRGESPRTLSVAVLHFVDGHSLTEVGALLDLSPKTVRHLLERFVARARKRSSRLDCKT